MKQYVIDELRPLDQEKLKAYFDKSFGPAEIGEIYWLPVEPDLYDDIQAAHQDCHPLFVAMQLTETALILELLVRTKNRIRCDCIRYVSEDQFLWLVRVVDSIFERLKIKT